jgi:Rrf2 family protein
MSAKGRYALAATISMVPRYRNGESVTVISISEKLGISKIYLEQVFSLLKRGGVVTSTKGSQGGYQLSREPRLISAFDILSAVELSLFEGAEATVPNSSAEIEAVIRKCVFEPLDKEVRAALERVSLEDLSNEAEQYKSGQGFMFYI